MEEEEHGYCDVISKVATHPIDVSQPSTVASLPTPNIIGNSSSQRRRQIFCSATQVILLIAVAIFAILSTVFMTLYFTKPCVCQNCSLVSNGRMNESKNFKDDKHCPVGNEIKTIIINCNETVPKSCSDFYKKGLRTEGIYTINPDGLGAFSVRCDMKTKGGGWTVFQRRLDGSVDFYRGWKSYKEGFGNLNGEFWLGLDKIHRLSKSGENILGVYLEDFENNARFVSYSTFAVANETDKYKLTVGGYNSGIIDDSLFWHNGMNFTTKDADNDLQSNINCAVDYKGAWWFNSCHSSHLNGQYLRGPHTFYANGIIWNGWKGHYYSLKKTEMKLHPRLL